MEVIELICFSCKHYGVTGVGCSAFPNGIPDIIQEKNIHKKPLPNQDNNIVFEKIDQ